MQNVQSKSLSRFRSIQHLRALKRSVTHHERIPKGPRICAENCARTEMRLRRGAAARAAAHWRTLPRPVGRLFQRRRGRAPAPGWARPTPARRGHRSRRPHTDPTAEQGGFTRSCAWRPYASASIWVGHSSPVRHPHAPPYSTTQGQRRESILNHSYSTRSDVDEVGYQRRALAPPHAQK